MHLQKEEPRGVRTGPTVRATNQPTNQPIIIALALGADFKNSPATPLCAASHSHATFFTRAPRDGLYSRARRARAQTTHAARVQTADQRSTWFQCLAQSETASTSSTASARPNAGKIRVLNTLIPKYGAICFNSHREVVVSVGAFLFLPFGAVSSGGDARGRSV